MIPQFKSPRLVVSLIVVIIIFTIITVLIFRPHEGGRNWIISDSPESEAPNQYQSSLSSHGRRELSGRRNTESLVVTGKDPKIRRVLQILQEFEKRRSKVTFDSEINGRRNIFFEISKPAEKELESVRKAVLELSESRVFPDGEKVRWSTFLIEQFYLDSPTSFTATIRESNKRTRFNYTISPLEFGRKNQRIHGGIEIEALLNKEVTWRFSHLISLGEAEVSESSKLE